MRSGADAPARVQQWFDGRYLVYVARVEMADATASIEQDRHAVGHAPLVEHPVRLRDVPVRPEVGQQRERQRSERDCPRVQRVDVVTGDPEDLHVVLGEPCVLPLN